MVDILALLLSPNIDDNDDAIIILRSTTLLYLTDLLAWLKQNNASSYSIDRIKELLETRKTSSLVRTHK